MKLTKKLKQEALDIATKYGYWSNEFKEFADNLHGKLGTEQYNKIHYIGQCLNIEGIRKVY